MAVATLLEPSGALAEQPASSTPAGAAPWNCAYPATACDASGLCVDLQTDSENCGHCGVSCGGQACVAGTCASRWDKESKFVGLSIGGLWAGTGHLKSGDFDWRDQAASPVQRYDFDPYKDHWLLSGQVGVRRRWVSSGFRLGVGHSSFALDSEDVAFLGRDSSLDYTKGDIKRNLLRLGPFVDVHAYTTKSRYLNLTLYGEVALNLELLLFKTTPDNPELSDQKDKLRDGFLSVVPSFGVGMDVALVGGLRTGIYGGMNISTSLWHFQTASYTDPYRLYRPSTILGGELRGTISYAFGHEKVRTGPTIYALLVEQSKQRASSAPAVSAAPGYAEYVAGPRNVALSAPKACRPTEGKPSAASGQVAAKREWCTNAMNQLEKLLSASGYNVLSWQSLPSSQDGALQSARQAGVELLFQVNLFDPEVLASGGSDLVWLRSDFQAHRGGALRQSVALSAHDQGQLDALSRAVAGHASNRARPGATLDVDVIEAAGGRPIWKYRVERELPASEVEKAQLLVEGRALPGGARIWSQTNPLSGTAARPGAGKGLAPARSAPDAQFLGGVLGEMLAQYTSGGSR